MQKVINTVIAYHKSYSHTLTKAQIARENGSVARGIQILLKKLNQKTKDAFWQRLPLDLRKYQHVLKVPSSTKYNLYLLKRDIRLTTDHIVKNYEGWGKIFLSRDAYLLYIKYYAKTKKNDAIELFYKRKNIIGDNNGPLYMQVIDSIYEAFNKSKDYPKFRDNFLGAFKKQKKLFNQIRENSLRVLENPDTHDFISRHDKIVVIDTGTQGGLALPLAYFLEEYHIRSDFFLYTCYPWLYSFYKNNAFTGNMKLLQLLENESAKLYLQDHE